MGSGGSGGSGTGWPCRATMSSSSPFTTPSSPPTTWKRLQISINRDCNRSDVSMRGSLLISNSGQYAPGFGIGALEELDAEDEDNCASGFAYEQTEVDIEPSKTTADDVDMDKPLNNQAVDPRKTSEGANMALNRLVAEDFLESLGKDLGLDVPSEKPAPPQNVIFISETLSTADTIVSSRIGKLTTCREIKENENSLDMVEIANANADGPSANVEKVDLEYEKKEHRAEKGMSHSSHHHTRNGSTESDSSIEQRWSRKRSRYRIWSGTPDSDSSGERYMSKKRKSYSRPRTGSRTRDAYSSSGSQQNKRMPGKNASPDSHAQY